MAEKVVIIIDDDEDEPEARPKDNEVIIIDSEGSMGASISGTNLLNPPSRKRHRILSSDIDDDDVLVTAFEPKKGWLTNPTIKIKTGGLHFPASGCSKCSTCTSNTGNKGNGSPAFDKNYQVALQSNGGITAQQSSVLKSVNPHATTSPGCRTPINTCTPVCSVMSHSTTYTPNTSLTNHSITPTPSDINSVHVPTPLSTVKQPASSKKSRSKSKRRQKPKAKTMTKTDTSKSDGDESDYKSSLSIPMFCIRSTGDISTLPLVTQFIASSSVPFISCDAPSWWSESKLFNISLEDPEARTVVYPLEYSGFQVLKVERIQTLHLWIRYLSEVKLLIHSRGENFKLNEALLYHCSKGSKNAICEEGLDVRLTHGGNFGRGIYFSDKPIKCHHYSTGTMYVCKVILGDTKVYSQGHIDIALTREPTKSNEPGSHYDSVKGFVTVGEEYVIYNSYRCIPLYVIEYAQK
ncbi:PREDICTED: uncharacterized protein LOC109580469 [Amphimedon queenslandica]|uniref:Poly [ADP-ribose] polymerase n=1 Tax=Amphimedon queenslandica TaxID=400682 RepID=A0A1X7VWM5_AMPQE|nr:PREDICTED: uncharacterized protein LOC109580469 [Amphimedon queenslandica]|eukprot:XP_019849426.1 PREDICTED: uncharacterized protein LOC109580469 [Amphimedon queenslandica]